jgi:hypothetical protein
MYAGMRSTEILVCEMNINTHLCTLAMMGRGHRANLFSLICTRTIMHDNKIYSTHEAAENDISYL